MLYPKHQPNLKHHSSSPYHTPPEHSGQPDALPKDSTEPNALSPESVDMRSFDFLQSSAFHNQLPYHRNL